MKVHGQWLDMIAPLYSYRRQQQQSRKAHRKAILRYTQTEQRFHMYYTNLHTYGRYLYCQLKRKRVIKREKGS